MAPCELFEEIKINAYEKHRSTIFASCDFCFVYFLNQEQVDQHVMYHNSPEWYNLWLIYCKKYQPNNPDSYLEPTKLTEPSENYKYKPSAENCVPKTPRVSEWDLTWEEWDATTQKPMDKEEILPTCDVCGETFIHQNTLDIHKKRPNCLEPKPQRFSHKLDVVSVRDGKEQKKRSKLKKLKQDRDFSKLVESDSASTSESESDELVFDDSSDLEMEFDELLDETPRKDLPIEMILPFHCYHCDKRFKLKPNLKRHEVIHQNERLIKVMKHPFFVKSKSSKKNVGLDLEKIVPSMCLPFMTRNLPKSSKDKLDRPKGRRTNKHKKVEATINPIYHFLQNGSQDLLDENELGSGFEKVVNTSTPMRKSTAIIHENLYMCRVCEESFATVDQLTNHLSSVHERKKHIYSVHEGKKPRQMGLKRVNLWSKKLKKTSEDNGAMEEFHCQPCAKTYRSKAKMDRHKNNEKHLKRLAATFDQLNDNRNPIEIMMGQIINDLIGKIPINSESETPTTFRGKRKSFNPRFQCPYCDSKFGHKQNMKSHIEAKHKDEFSTTNFSKIFPMENESINQTPNNTINPRFQCPYCDSKFGKKYSMKKHVEVKHNEEFPTTDFRKISPIDNESFTGTPNKTTEDYMMSEQTSPIDLSRTGKYNPKTVAFLQNNGKMDESLVKEEFHCLPCGKAYPSRWHLKQHEKTQVHLKNLGSMDVKFNDVPENTTESMVKQIINDLIKEVPFNESWNEKIFYCQLCEKTYHSKHSLKVHEKTEIHLKNLGVKNDVSLNESLDKEEFICHPCGKKFNIKAYLIRHEQTQQHLKHLKELDNNYVQDTNEAMAGQIITDLIKKVVPAKESNLSFTEMHEKNQGNLMKRDGRIWPCGKCEQCLRIDCGLCLPCSDKTKFGGRNILRKKCVDKICPIQEQLKRELQATKQPIPTIDSIKRNWMDVATPNESNTETTVSLKKRRYIPQNFQCPYCDKSYSQKSTMKIHVMDKHEEQFESTDFSKILSKEKQNFQSLPINDDENSIEKSKNTDETIEKTNEIIPVEPFSPFDDNEFGLVFKKEDNIETPVENKNDDDEKPFMCNICENSFGKIEELSNHLSTVHKSHESTTEEKEETFNGSLKHSDSLPLNDTKESMNDSKTESPLSMNSTRFQCSYCDSNYAQKTNLYTHVKQKHEEHFDAWKLANNLNSSSKKESAKAFQCSYCESKYAQKYNLKAHIKKFHNENNLKVDSSKNMESSQIYLTDDQKTAEENQENKEETFHELTNISELKNINDPDNEKFHNENDLKVDSSKDIESSQIYHTDDQKTAEENQENKENKEETFHELTTISVLKNTNDPTNDSSVEPLEKKDESFNDSTIHISESLLLNHTNELTNISELKNINDPDNEKFPNENDLKVDSSNDIESSQIHHTDQKTAEENKENKEETFHELTNISVLKNTNDPTNNFSVETLEKKDELFNDSTKHISESLLLNHTNESLNVSRDPTQKKLSNTSTRFQCSFCDSNYAQKSNLHTHVKQKHVETLKSEGKLEPSSNKIGAKPFQCPYCESKFSQKHNLKSHVKQKHEENFKKTDFRNIRVEISNDLENNSKTSPINRKRKSIGQSGNAKISRQISKVLNQSEETFENLEEFEIDDVEPAETRELPIYVEPIKKTHVTLIQVLGEDDL